MPSEAREAGQAVAESQLRGSNKKKPSSDLNSNNRSQLSSVQTEQSCWTCADDAIKCDPAAFLPVTCSSQEAGALGQVEQQGHVDFLDDLAAQLAR